MGSLASVAWNPYTVSVGASGAVFGVYGALLGFFLMKKDDIPKMVWKPLGKSAVAFLGYNMVYGLFKEGIDVHPVVYPAVPDTSARLRFFVSTAHTKEQIRAVIDILDRIMKQMKIK